MGKFGATALAIALALGAATGASAAETVNVTGYGFVYAPAVTGTLHYTGVFGSASAPNNSNTASNINVNIQFGQYKMNKVGGGDPVESYCVDIFQSLIQGTMSFTVGNTITLNTKYSSSVAAKKQVQLNTLLSNLAAANNATKSAAMQLALWEVLYEPVTSNYAAGSGTFYLNNLNNSAVIAQANTYLGKVTGSNPAWKVSRSLQLRVYGSTSRQDQVEAFVPEPATWGMMVVGFGALGMAMRRRRGARLATA